MQGLRPLERYFDFAGRSGRAEYWQWIAVSTVAGWVTGILDALSSSPYSPSHKVTGLLAISTLIPGVAVGIRRLHDRGRSGWHYGVFCLLFGLACGTMLVGQQINQQSGDDSVLGFGVVTLAIWLIYAIYVIVQLAKPGDHGSNAYGEPDVFVPVSANAGLVGNLVGPVAPRPSASPAEDALTKIERLAQLRDQGVLTDAEFTAQKRQLLGSGASASTEAAAHLLDGADRHEPSSARDV